MGGGHWLLHIFIKDGYWKMTQIDTRGEGGGPKLSKKLTRIIWMAPKENILFYQKFK